MGARSQFERKGHALVAYASINNPY
jgi:hypothetical protein